MCWHLEGGNNFVVQLPTIEGIAIHSGLVGNLYSGIDSLLRCLREGGSSGGSCAGIGVGHIELVGLPHGIQIIGVFVIHQHLFACGIVNRPAGGGAPTPELIAITAEAQSIRTRQSYEAIVGQLNRIGSLRSTIGVVGMVGQGRACGSIAPDGVEGDVGVMDGNLVAGLIDGAAAYLGTPAQEHLALGGSQRGSGHDIGVGAVGIGLGIHRHNSGAIGAVVGDGEGLVAGVVGVKGNIAANFRIEVEGGVDIVGSSSAPHSPVSPGVAVGNSDRGEILLVDLGAIGDLNRSRFIALYGQIGSSGNGRRSPLGVDSDVLGRHVAGEHILLALAQFIVVPAHEGVLRRNTRRTGGSVRNTGDILLVPFGDRVFRAFIDKLNLVVFPVVVEFGASVTITVLGAECGIHGEACDGITILIGNAVSGRTFGGVIVVQNIIQPITCHRALAAILIQGLNEVGNHIFIAAAFPIIELVPAQRHRIDIGLISYIPVVGG